MIPSMRARKRYALIACLAVILLMFVALFAANKRDTRHAIEENNRRLCALLAAQDEAYKIPPGPTSEIGQRIAYEVANLRRAYACP